MVVLARKAPGRAVVAGGHDPPGVAVALDEGHGHVTGAIGAGLEPARRVGRPQRGVGERRVGARRGDDPRRRHVVIGPCVHRAPAGGVALLEGHEAVAALGRRRHRHRRHAEAPADDRGGVEHVVLEGRAIGAQRGGAADPA